MLRCVVLCGQLDVKDLFSRTDGGKERGKEVTGRFSLVVSSPRTASASNSEFAIAHQ